MELIPLFSCFNLSLRWRKSILVAPSSWMPAQLLYSTTYCTDPKLLQLLDFLLQLHILLKGATQI